jgi:hypothetical protein
MSTQFFVFNLFGEIPPKVTMAPFGNFMSCNSLMYCVTLLLLFSSYESQQSVFEFSGVLSRLKIASLDGERKQAKVQYTEHMNSYATTMFGRPMEKLNVSSYLVR